MATSPAQSTPLYTYDMRVINACALLTVQAVRPALGTVDTYPNAPPDTADQVARHRWACIQQGTEGEIHLDICQPVPVDPAFDLSAGIQQNSSTGECAPSPEVAALLQPVQGIGEEAYAGSDNSSPTVSDVTARVHGVAFLMKFAPSLGDIPKAEAHNAYRLTALRTLASAIARRIAAASPPVGAPTPTSPRTASETLADPYCHRFQRATPQQIGDCIINSWRHAVPPDNSDALRQLNALGFPPADRQGFKPNGCRGTGTGEDDLGYYDGYECTYKSDAAVIVLEVHATASLGARIVRASAPAEGD